MVNKGENNIRNLLEFAMSEVFSMTLFPDIIDDTCYDIVYNIVYSI